MKPVLLDTGVIVALLDRSERHHARCRAVAQELSAALITCEAVIAESCYLLRHSKGAADAILENVQRGVFQVPFDLSLGCSKVRPLMKKYAGVPMDFADACLVVLAQEFETGDILTLDSDFSTYRWDKNRPFKNLIGPLMAST